MVTNTPSLLYIETPTEIPAHLMQRWKLIRRVAKYNYPRAMRMANAWGAALADWEVSKINVS